MNLDSHSGLLASFAGAVAYLAVKGKMAAAQAVFAVIAGTAAAYYLAPGLVEYLETERHLVIGERATAAITFLVGVGGVWLLTIGLTLLQAVNQRATDIVGRTIDRIFGVRAIPPSSSTGDDEERRKS